MYAGVDTDNSGRVEVEAYNLGCLQGSITKSCEENILQGLLDYLWFSFYSTEHLFGSQ